MNDYDRDYRVANPENTHRWIAHCRAQLGIKTLAAVPSSDADTGEIVDEPVS